MKGDSALQQVGRKPAGLYWLNDVPSHWEVKRLKFTVDGCYNGIWGSEPDGADDDIACVRVADFDRLRFLVKDKVPTVRSVSRSERRRRELRRGDLLLEKSGGGELQPVGAVALFDHDFPAVCSNFVARLAVNRSCDSRFLSFLHAALYAGRINERSIKQTTGIQNLDGDSYLSEYVPIPPVEEQRAIATFLDRETARIDSLIEKKRRLIAILQERRVAVIAHAVTRGVDESVPLKDSGSPWIGRVPRHWDVCRIKMVARLESGHTPSKSVPEYWEDCDIPWVSLNDSKQLARADYISETAVQINRRGLENSSARILPGGAVVFTRDATIGLAAITTRPMAVSQHLIAWIPGPRISARFLLRVFHAMKPFLDSYTFGATIKTIGMPDVKKLVAPIPPIAEQDEIADAIDRATGQIDRTVEHVAICINRLTEYRTALISAAVTGQIDVREAA